MIIRISSTRSPATSIASAPWPSTPPVPLFSPPSPPGRFVGTVSLDSSFRLWDVETGNQLLLQDGHARDVMGLSFQRDGSLAATCDQSGVCRLWDLRSGRSALVLQVGREKRALADAQGHAKGMLCCRFAPNGFQVGPRTAVKGSWRRGATTTRSRCGICGGRRRFIRCRRTEM